MITKLCIWWRRRRGWTVIDRPTTLRRGLHCSRLWIAPGATLDTAGFLVYASRELQIDGRLISP